MSHWNSYKDDPFFYEQDHNEEKRIDDNMEWAENNVPLNVQMPNVQMPNVQMPNVPMPPVQMPAAPMENVPMPAAPMPAAPMPAVQMPIAAYPFPPMCGCPPVIWCCPYPMAEAMPSFADGDFDSPDMAPQTMPLEMENAPNPTMEDTELPMSENPDSVAPTMMPTQGTFAPSPMFPVAGMAPTVPFPTCGPIMPLGTMPAYYTPASYYGGAAPYGPFFSVPYVPYW
jgi:hypothetical protein